MLVINFMVKVTNMNIELDGKETKNVKVEVSHVQILKELLKKALPHLAHNDFSIKNGKLYFWERTHWYDSDWVLQRDATPEEIEIYNAYEVFSNKLRDVKIMN